jgi:hypothetical protein
MAADMAMGAEVGVVSRHLGKEYLCLCNPPPFTPSSNQVHMVMAFIIMAAMVFTTMAVPIIMAEATILAITATDTDMAVMGMDIQGIIMGGSEEWKEKEEQYVYLIVKINYLFSDVFLCLNPVNCHVLFYLNQ